MLRTRPQFPTRRLAVALALLTAAVSSAAAATRSAEFTVSVTVLARCDVALTRGNGLEPAQVSCTSATPYQVVVANRRSNALSLQTTAGEFSRTSRTADAADLLLRPVRNDVALAVAAASECTASWTERAPIAVEIVY